MLPAGTVTDALAETKKYVQRKVVHQLQQLLNRQAARSKKQNKSGVKEKTEK
jgi:hypothetical protein